MSFTMLEHIFILVEQKGLQISLSQQSQPPNFPIPTISFCFLSIPPSSSYSHPQILEVLCNRFYFMDQFWLENKVTIFIFSFWVLNLVMDGWYTITKTAKLIFGYNQIRQYDNRYLYMFLHGMFFYRKYMDGQYLHFVCCMCTLHELLHSKL